MIVVSVFDVDFCFIVGGCLVECCCGVSFGRCLVVFVVWCCCGWLFVGREMDVLEMFVVSFVVGFV